MSIQLTSFLNFSLRHIVGHGLFKDPPPGELLQLLSSSCTPTPTPHPESHYKSTSIKFSSPEFIQKTPRHFLLVHSDHVIYPTKSPD